MNGRTYRDVLRWLHIFWGVVLGVYIYMPGFDNELFTALMRFFVFPALAIEGLLLWQQVRVFKFLQRRGWAGRASAGGER